MGKITGNKGEWSELYVLLYLLAHNKLYAADESLNRLENIFFPVMKIFREESKEHKVEYVLPQNNILVQETSEGTGSYSAECSNSVAIYVNDSFAGKIQRDEIKKAREELYKSIINGPGRAFPIEGTEMLMNNLHCCKIKASSSEKADIVVQIHDINTGYEPICGFSIKSDLGSAPTLLNASLATNFIYRISGLSLEQVEKINAINTKKKIIDRLAAIDAFGANIEYQGMCNSVFCNNLLMIDSMMHVILGYIILYSYRTGVVDCSEIIEKIEELNPMKYPRKGLYTYKFKQFLCAIALGMMPSKEWSGYDEANGGYIIVKSSGDVVAYHIYNRNMFQDYLLKNTKFERGSTTKHKYASIYQQDADLLMNLNLQIRFK